MKRIGLVIGILITVAALFLLKKEAATGDVSSKKSMAAVQLAKAADKTSVTPVVSEEKITAAIQEKITSENSESSSSAATTVADVVKADDLKDDSPQAVLDWSTDLGRLMMETMNDESKAAKTFESLRGCALNAAAAEPYRAMCAANALRLDKKYPAKFGQNFQSMVRALSPKVQEFLAQVNTDF